MPAGYSGAPLPRKLGIKEGSTFAVVNGPAALKDALGELPAGAKRVRLSSPGRIDVTLHFMRSLADLDGLSQTIDRMEPDASLWICWAKKSSPLAVPDVDEGVIRSSGLAAGVVDVKIGAIDSDWSGLKFMFRLEHRPSMVGSRSRTGKK